jgi:NADH-quinone oxidoreductase subunit J
MSLYIFSVFILLIFCSSCVIISNNPIQSILFLILVFLFSAFLFMFLGAEFVSLLILIIYIGAIAILFLFVIMMLNLRIIEVYNAFFNYLPIGSLIAFFFIGEILILIYYDFAKIDLLLDVQFLKDSIVLKELKFNNLHFFGQLLFNYYIYFFLMVGLILFISMIGSIIILINPNKQAPFKNKEMKFLTNVNSGEKSKKDNNLNLWS